MNKNKERIKTFKKQIKKYKQNQKHLSNYLADEYDCNNGYATIDINLKDQEIFNPLSMGKQKSLNNAIYDFIDELIYPIPAYIPVKIYIHGVSDEKMKQEITQMIQEHYDLNLKDKEIDLKINLARSITLFGLGIIMLGIYFFLANFMKEGVWYEVLSIISSFIIWESADYFVLERHSLRISYNDAAQIALAQVEFVDE